MLASNSVSITTPALLNELARRLIARFRAARALRAERLRVRVELSRYSDRELADMGLSRNDIEDVVASVRTASSRIA